jgi:hypothetical protein
MGIMLNTFQKIISYFVYLVDKILGFFNDFNNIWLLFKIKTFQINFRIDSSILGPLNPFTILTCLKYFVSESNES